MMWELQGSLIQGGQAASGIMPVARLDGGGMWKAALGVVRMWTADQRRSWRAFSAICDGGVQPVAVHVRETFDGPFPTVGGSVYYGEDDVNFSDGSLFSDGSGFHSGAINAYTVGSSNLRATAMAFRIMDGVELKGGEYFSIDHAQLRWRLYRIATAVKSDNIEGSDDYTKVLLHFDSSLLDLSFGGETVFGRVWTAAGNATFDTTNKKFGVASLTLDGTGDYITTPDSPDFTLGTSNHTIDFWFRCTTAGGAFRGLCGQQNSGGTTASSSIRIYRNTSNQIQVDYANGGSTFLSLTSTTTFTNAINPGFHHFAVTRSGNTFRLFIDGVVEDTDTSATSVNDSSEVFGIGVVGANTGAGTWQGNIDEFRFSNGIARWTSAFTVPAKAYGIFWTVTFRPPLREAIDTNVEVNFDAPRCTMRLANANAMDLTLEPPNLADGAVEFMEAMVVP